MERRLSQYRQILKEEPELFEASELLFHKHTKSSFSAHPPKHHDLQANHDAITVVAIYVMAPVMYRFVEWVLLNACKAGFKRLYFLARDGHSMYELARIINDRLALHLELEYLYCSRYALRTAWYHLKLPESLAYICLSGIEVTFETVMLRAGFDGEKAAWFADLLDFGHDYNTKALTLFELGLLRERLENCNEFVAQVVANAQNNYPNIKGYLQQEGLYDDVPYAFVDSGWVGSMQKILTDLVNETAPMRHHPLSGYYFGLYDYPSGVDRQSYHTYYFAPNGGIRRKASFANCLFECIFSSPEGMTIGYQKDDTGRYIPILANAKNANSDKIIRTSKLLSEYASDILIGEAVIRPKSAKTSQKLLSLFMGQPTGAEAEAFGSYIFCDDIIGEKSQTVAALLSSADIRNNRLTRRILSMRRGSPKIRESAWLSGSVVLGMNKPSLELKRVIRYRRILYFRKAISEAVGRKSF